MRKFILILITCFITTSVWGSEYTKTHTAYRFVKHKHSESSYQHAWCKAHGGIEEYINKDGTRVDCLTKTHAVEFDFANKWAESVGQAEHYALMTKKRGKVVLILEYPLKQKIYYYRVKRLAQKHNFDVEYVTPKILGINKNGKCNYPDCKCNQAKKKNKRY